MLLAGFFVLISLKLTSIVAVEHLETCKDKDNKTRVAKLSEQEVASRKQV